MLLWLGRHGEATVVRCVDDLKRAHAQSGRGVDDTPLLRHRRLSGAARPGKDAGWHRTPVAAGQMLSIVRGRRRWWGEWAGGAVGRSQNVARKVIEVGLRQLRLVKS